MLTRVAIFEGAIVAGGNAFFDHARERLEPIWRRSPHILDVRVLRTREVGLEAIPVVMALEMDFPGLGSIRASLASAIRTEAHRTILEVLKPFSGRFFDFATKARSLGAGAQE